MVRRRLAAGIALVAVGLFIGLLAYGLAKQAPNTDIDTALDDSRAVRAPGFRLPVLQRGELRGRLQSMLSRAARDGEVDLRELRGAPVVLNFWASWCLPCRAEAPRLERAWSSARRVGTAFVGLNMQDATADARGFMREFGVSYLNVRDKSNGVARRWGVSGLPETFFLGHSGKVVAHVIGAVSDRQLRAGIAAAESGRALGSLEGGDRRSTR